ncbi:hypothetical protein LB467_12115 [Salegentibacter sp. JZCK2]|uniref:hypothetical protein n=1 Tax=Salegentibacter tibetensis TaxID=2873600 RepID=UPI001CC9BAE4|nr:hypothetical protein [Salegentibacter tibetensis]MBZ9730431.1 hypothetical protein [Salegentibacter tibetensis]
MQNRSFNIISLLLVLLLSITSNTVFAFSTTVVNLDSRNYDYLQAEQNQQAVIFSEIISSENIISEENFPNSSGNLCSSFSSKKKLLISVEKNAFFNALDQRQLILQQIFPFHFFW